MVLKKTSEMRTSNRMLNMAPNIAGHTDQVTKPDLEILYASTKLIICFFFKLECKKKFLQIMLIGLAELGS